MEKEMLYKIKEMLDDYLDMIDESEQADKDDCIKNEDADNKSGHPKKVKVAIKVTKSDNEDDEMTDEDVMKALEGK